MPNILAIETSSDACSVALSFENEISSFHEIAPQKHTEKLFGFIQELMKERRLKFSQLDAVAVGHGPGSFTGIRLACSAAQGIAYSAGISAVSISSMEVVAQYANSKIKQKDIVVLVDAHMKQIYVGRFKFEGEELIYSDEEVVLVQKFLDSNFDSKSCFIGGGCKLVEKKLSKLNSPIYDDHYPNAVDLLSLAQRRFITGQIILPEEVLPVYLSGEEHWTKG